MVLWSTWDPYFKSWNDFASEFQSRFLPDRECKSAMLKLESTRYHRTFQEYLNEFQDLIALKVPITMKFRRKLDSIIQSRVAESADCPSEEDFEGWYSAAQHVANNCVANQSFHFSQHSAHPQTLFPPFRKLRSRSESQWHSARAPDSAPTSPTLFPTPASSH